jgi:RinA family phage transcriptional activator
MTDYRWRQKAKQLLFEYPNNLRQLKLYENDVIYGRTYDFDNRYRRGGISNPTQAKSLLLDNEHINRLRRDIGAVERLINSLATNRRIDKQQLRLLKLVYFQGSFCLYGVAVELHTSERTVKRWNRHILECIAKEMGWLED